MADSGAKEEIARGEYVIGIAVILAALLISASVYVSANNVVASANNVADVLSKKSFAVNVQGSGQQAAPTTPTTPTTPASSLTEVGTVAGNYIETTEPVCKDANALSVKMFATSWCPHCAWEKPVLTNATAAFGDKVKLEVFDVDLQALSAADDAMYQKYNPSGTIPTIVLGCKYYKIGSGETLGAEGEAAAIKQLICKSLGSDAPSFCAAS